MATGIGPKKSLFKRRAGPVIVQKITEPHPALNSALNPASTLTSTSTLPSPPPASLTGASSSGLTQDGGAINTDFDSSPPRPAANDPGIDLFRRAKHFYPRAVEASLRAGAKQDGANSHDPKRRKVSSEQDGTDNDVALTLSSRSPSASPLAHDATSPLELRDSSKSPSPLRRLDKGKGIATQHTVNAGIIFTDVSPTSRKRASPEADAEAGEEAEATAETDTNTNTNTNTGDDSVIVLDDSDTEDTQPQKQRPRKDSWEEDDDEASKKRRPRRLEHTIKDDDDDSGDGLAEVIDPEFEEYIIRARARDAASRAAREIQEINAQLGASARRSTSGEHAAAGANDTDMSFESQATVSSTATAVASEPPPQPLSEQSYRIFITPRLPWSVPPLIANVRMDQEMRHVKNAFISHAREKGYEMPPEVAKSVLLTWKGAKIYDFTTGLTLKLNPDAKGRFHEADGLGGLSSFTGGDANDNGSHRVSSGFVSGGLHIEIWTNELYERYIVEQEKRRRRNMGETLEEDLLSDDEYDGGGGGGDRNSTERDSFTQFKREESAGSRSQPHKTQKTQQTHDKIRLVLASRSYDKLSVTAHSDTTIDTLIQAFRIQRGIAADKTVTVWMDGEQLDGGTTVGDADLEDMDSVEVHIS
ncbi:hypothetical protein F503_03098 [Ophiostoma piceae UAMH 11346]|uniref:Ubiquitin-like domain-containing protein n=1 Tax=Ophiostoma piceae (strain UAMH 11346) TaxID=1262450 RepID=S3C4C9_OPHP1|nr:hypothetical protein F503_03098 [Ophiostoma piceae UAMH 11346]